jgi:hypothetical protein|tara:strand:- start:35 stop:691 length:657 start_codon:yes stop_codon:yes gene_type:complete
MKKVQIIGYNVGYGGNILRFLLSLHDNTFPLYPKTMFDKDKPRHDIYSFKNLQWKHGNWAEYETSDAWQKIGTAEYLQKFLAQDDYNTLTVADHPDEFDLEVFRKPNIELSFLTIDISEKYESLIQDFLKLNQKIGNYFPLEGSERHNTINELLVKYKKNFHPYSFNHDCFIEGEESFLEEYKRLLTHLNYTLDEDVLTNAMTLYRGWCSARMIKIPK